MKSKSSIPWFLNKKEEQKISFYIHLLKFWLDQVVLLCSGFALRFMGSHLSWVAHSSPYGFKTLLMGCGDCWVVSINEIQEVDKNTIKIAPPHQFPGWFFPSLFNFQCYFREKFWVRKNVVNFLSALLLNWENCLTISFYHNFIFGSD